MKELKYMSESHACLAARASLEKIHALKQAFDLEYTSATIQNNSKNTEHIKETRSALKEKIQALGEQTWSFEIERTVHLQQQYTFQLNLLKELNLLESKTEIDSSGNEEVTFFMIGIDGNHYPFPSLTDIVKHSFEKKDLLRTKTDQKFTELVIVPFGMSLDRLVSRVASALIQYKKPTNRLKNLSEFTPVHTPPLYVEADRKGVLIYDPELTDENHLQGKTKSAILEQQNKDGHWSTGWRILLLQKSDYDNGIRAVPHHWKGTVHGKIHPREEIPAGRAPLEYVRLLQAANADPSSSYWGESGMTPEEWLITFMTHFKKTYSFLDEIGSKLVAFDTAPCLSGACLVDYTTNATIARFSNQGNSLQLSVLPVERMLPAVGARFSVRI